jgi:integrase
MPTDLIPRNEQALIPEGALDRADDLALKALSANTWKAYSSAWRAFEAWCAEKGRSPLPADEGTVRWYLTHLSERAKRRRGAGKLRISSIKLALSAISQRHLVQNLPSPRESALVRKTMQGLENEIGAPPEYKTPLLDEQMGAVLEELPSDLRGVRDRAILTFGFAGAFRESEIVGLDVSDLGFVDEGIVVHLRRSKTNQTGKEETVGVPYGSKLSQCPVKSVQAWLEAACIAEGAVFRPISRHGKLGTTRLEPRYVADVVKKYASKALGVDASRFAGHSLRSGFATSAFYKGRSEISVANQTRHKNLNMLRRYIHRTNLFRDKGLL